MCVCACVCVFGAESGFHCWGVREPALVLFSFYGRGLEEDERNTLRLRKGNRQRRSEAYLGQSTKKCNTEGNMAARTVS